MASRPLPWFSPATRRRHPPTLGRYPVRAICRFLDLPAHSGNIPSAWNVFDQKDSLSMHFLLRSRGSRIRPGADRIDASLYDACISKFAPLDLDGMVVELRTWTDTIPVSRATAAMARLLDLALLCASLTESDRQRAATLAIVVEQIVRTKLSSQPAAITTVEGAYRLLFQFGEARTACPGIADWIQTERRQRGLPQI